MAEAGAISFEGWGATTTLTHLVCDFNGTLAVDGALIAGVAPRLRALAQRIPVTVLTADTFGTARAATEVLPVSLTIVATSDEKARFVGTLGAGVVALGNGANDASMLRAATLALAVAGREGMARALLDAADIIVSDVNDALDLLLNPRRLTATLRS